MWCIASKWWKEELDFVSVMRFYSGFKIRLEHFNFYDGFVWKDEYFTDSIFSYIGFKDSINNEF